MAKKKPVVTNAMRILQAAKIPFSAIEYKAEEVGEDFGMRISELTGIPYSQSFKTLVAIGGEVAVVCIPVNKELDLKKLAAEMGSKKAELIHVKELQALTGYIRGGVSPIGMKKKYMTFIDESCLGFDEIAVSGGVCGVTLLMKTQDLIGVTDAKVCNITR